MRRILVTGITGAGTTLAQAMAGRLGIGFHEMDALALCGPAWQENPSLLNDVEAITAGPGWVFDSLGYLQVRDLLWTRADGIVWLDYPRRVVMARVLRRSAARTLRRERVFGGNVETFGLWFTRDHPAWWAWSQYEARRAEIAARCDGICNARPASMYFAPTCACLRARTRLGRACASTTYVPGVPGSTPRRHQSHH